MARDTATELSWAHVNAKRKAYAKAWRIQNEEKHRDPSAPTKECRTCGLTKTLPSFYPQPECRMGVTPQCRSCINEQAKARLSEEGKISKKEYDSARYLANRERYLSQAKEWKSKNRQRDNDWRSDRSRRIRAHIIDGYGGACACCGESRYEFLAIDHVNNDGAEQRRNKIRGLRLMRSIVLNNFPPQYQVLCHNCNYAKYAYGRCPHDAEVVLRLA